MWDHQLVCVLAERLANATQRTLAVESLESGMRLSRDLIAPSGLLLLASGSRLSDAMVKRLSHLVTQGELRGVIVSIHVR